MLSNLGGPHHSFPLFRTQKRDSARQTPASYLTLTQGEPYTLGTQGGREGVAVPTIPLALFGFPRLTQLSGHMCVVLSHRDIGTAKCT